METLNPSRQSFDSFQTTALIFIVVSILFSFYLAMTNPLNEDELHDLHQGWEIADGAIMYEHFNALPYPANAALASWSFQITGGRFAGVLLNRALAVCFHIGTLLLIFAIASRLFSREAGLFSAFTWAGLGFVIMKGGEFRSVHPALLMVLSSFYLYLQCRLEKGPMAAKFFFSGAAAGLAFLFKANYLIYFFLIVLFEFLSRIKKPKRLFSPDLLMLLLGPVVVFVLYLASFADWDRIYRYLYFQYQVLIYANTFPEARWLKNLVISFWSILPLTIAVAIGIWSVLTRTIDRRKITFYSALLVAEGLILFMVMLRKIYFQHNFLLPAVIPVLFAGVGFDAFNKLSKLKRNKFQWVLLTAMIGCAVASVYIWNQLGAVRFTYQFYYDEFKQTVPYKDRCNISAKELLSLEDSIAVDWSYYHLSLEDHKVLWEFMESLDGSTLTAYDGFEAVTPVRGAAYLDGFPNSTFREKKYQGVYEMMQKNTGWLGKKAAQSGWQLFHDMSLDNAQKALVKELMTAPPGVLIMDGFMLGLMHNHEDYAQYLEKRYSFFLLPDAHVIVGLRKGLVPPGGPYDACTGIIGTP